MEDDVDRIGARDLRDQREQAVPEREGVARVEATVGELVRAREGEVVEGEELLHPGEVEEPVAADVPGDVPERDAQRGTRREHRAAARHAHVRRVSPHREGQRDDARAEDEDERQRERRGGEERDGEGREDEPDAPGDRRRCAPEAERARDERSGREHDREPEDQLEDEQGTCSRAQRTDPAIRASTSPEPSHVPTSR